MGNDGLSGPDVLGLSDACQNERLKWEKFCIVINFGAADKKFCTDAPDKAILEVAKKKAEKMLDDNAEGTNLLKIKKYLGNVLGLVKSTDAATIIMASKGTFGIGMEVYFRCCVCTEGEWKWGKSNFVDAYFQNDAEGLTYQFSELETFRNFAQDYTDTINSLSQNIAQGCGLQ